MRKLLPKTGREIETATGGDMEADVGGFERGAGGRLDAWTLGAGSGRTRTQKRIEKKAVLSQKMELALKTHLGEVINGNGKKGPLGGKKFTPKQFGQEERAEAAVAQHKRGGRRGLALSRGDLE